MNGNMDRFNRRIDYLRVAITDRCNLRCLYCVPQHGFNRYDHSEILTYEEIIRIVKAAVGLGIKKVRLTGGEPLVRLDVCSLVRRLANIPQIEDLAMTTNGVRLNEMALPLYNAGLKRINLSLDTLNALNFYRISHKDRFDDVWKGLARAEAIGFSPIKINMVVIRGVNDKEICSLARLSIEKPYAIRFIEYMPIGSNNRWRPDHLVPVSEMKTRLETIAPLTPLRRSASGGPAESYRFPDARGEIGFIGAVSHQFCLTCNRLRLTPDGKLRPCLMHGVEIDIKTPLRRGCAQRDLKMLLQKAIASKPQGASIQSHGADTGDRIMSHIGG